MDLGCVELMGYISWEDLPIEVVRSLAGDEIARGVSTISPEEAEDAVRRGADYIAIEYHRYTTTKGRKCIGMNLSVWNTWNM